MWNIRFHKKVKHFCSILLVLVCILLFSSPVDISINSPMQDVQTSDINQEDISENGAKQNTLLPETNKIPVADIFVHDTGIYQITQRLISVRQLSSYRDNSCMITFIGLLYSFLFLIILCFISRFDQRTLCKFKRHSFIPHSIHAPPYIFA